MPRILTAVFAALWTLPAAGQSFDTIATADHGAWKSAEMVNSLTGKRFCAAETLSLYDQVLRLVLYEGGDAFLEVVDVSWDYVNGDPLRFNLIVDGMEQVVTGQGWTGSISLDLLDTGARAALLAKISGADRLDIRLPNRSRVAQFQLDGADAAIAAAKNCWAEISGQN